MDFGDFEKQVRGAARAANPAVTQAARAGVSAAIQVAPAYQTAAVAAAGIFAPPAAPLIAALPPDVVLAVGAAPATFGLSLLILAPELRPDRKGAEIDYANLGFIAATQALKGQ